jgi:hypothetical protein
LNLQKGDIEKLNEEDRENLKILQEKYGKLRNLN